MYDRKVVRRRRAALAVFVALSIAILTAYFGESGGGFFHALQRGAQEAFAPIETGASRALKPVRDFFGWAGDTVDLFGAKAENARLRKEVETLREQVIQNQTAVQENERLREETLMPVHLAESPLTCVAVGSGRSLEEFEAIHRSAKARQRNGKRRY